MARYLLGVGQCLKIYILELVITQAWSDGNTKPSIIMINHKFFTSVTLYCSIFNQRWFNIILSDI